MRQYHYPSHRKESARTLAQPMTCRTVKEGREKGGVSRVKEEERGEKGEESRGNREKSREKEEEGSEKRVEGIEKREEKNISL